MKTNIFLLSLLLILISCKTDNKNKFETGKTIPYFKLIDNYGNEIESTDFAGKVLLIDFWASYCGPCKEQFEHLLKPLYENINIANFEILGISSDTDIEKWNNAIKKENLMWKQVCLVLNKNDVLEKYQVTGLPTTILVDKEGRLIGKDLGKEVLLETLTKELNADTLIIKLPNIEQATKKYTDWRDYVSNMIFEVEEYIYENTTYPLLAKENNIVDSIPFVLTVGMDFKLEFGGFYEYHIGTHKNRRKLINLDMVVKRKQLEFSFP